MITKNVNVTRILSDYIDLDSLTQNDLYFKGDCLLGSAEVRYLQTYLQEIGHKKFDDVTEEDVNLCIGADIILDRVGVFDRYEGSINIHYKDL